MPRALKLATLFALAAALTGCDSGPQFCRVEGTVTIDGKPLTGGRIVISNLELTEEGVADITIGGTFAIPRAPAGEVKAVVRTEHVKNLLSERTAKALQKKGVAAAAVDPKVQGNVYVAIPKEYGDAATTPLKFTLASNKTNTITVELKR